MVDQNQLIGGNIVVSRGSVIDEAPTVSVSFRVQSPIAATMKLLRPLGPFAFLDRQRACDNVHGLESGRIAQRPATVHPGASRPALAQGLENSDGTSGETTRPRMNAHRHGGLGFGCMNLDQGDETRRKLQAITLGETMGFGKQ